MVPGGRSSASTDRRRTMHEDIAGIRECTLRSSALAASGFLHDARTGALVLGMRDASWSDGLIRPNPQLASGEAT